MSRPKLILLNGAAGVGKTTIAEHYIAEHPLTLSISRDEIIVMIGQWFKHETAAKSLTFELIKSMAITHLRRGHDVLLPYLLTDATRAEAFEKIAKDLNIDYKEILLHTTKEDAVQRLLKRGTWGEAGSTPVTAATRPIIEALYDTMMRETNKRPQTIVIESVYGQTSKTYEAFLAAIES